MQRWEISFVDKNNNNDNYMAHKKYGLAQLKIRMTNLKISENVSKCHSIFRNWSLTTLFKFVLNAYTIQNYLTFLLVE